jgi:hypothetical protein
MDGVKQSLAWLIAGLLDRTRPYSAADIDRLIRATIRGEYLGNTSLAPDHIRVAMVEASYLTRDPTGAAYWVAKAFVGPEEVAERERTLLRVAGELDLRSGVVVCPACGSRMGATSLLGHCQRSHRWSKRWEILVEKYCR